MSIQSVIEEKIGVRFKPHHLLINNESNLHSGPSTESHFKLTVVSDSFLGLSRVNRHRQIYDLLSEELENGVHALVLHLFTTDELVDKVAIFLDFLLQGIWTHRKYCRSFKHSFN